MGFLFRRQDVPKPDCFSIADSPLSEPSEFEISGTIDPFTNLEEIAPDLEWSEAISAAWGLPAPDRSAAPTSVFARFWSRLQPQPATPKPVPGSKTEYEPA